MDTKKTSQERERLFVDWLESIKSNMKALYLMGDIFDYWYEYKHTVPKGYARLFGKLAELKDAGKEIYFFTGNHDLWMKDYFPTEFGIPVYHDPIIKRIGNKNFYLGHGDGLGPADRAYKVIKMVFRNKLCQWLFTRIHPNTAISLMRFFSRKSREATEGHQFLGPEKEWLIQYSESVIMEKEEIDYFIFGHRHLPINHLLSNNKTSYINLGDWTDFYSFARFDGEKLHLEFFQDENKVIFGNNA